MGITFGDHLTDSGHNDITPEQEHEIEAREECARRGLNPDDDAADGATVWMVVDQEMRERGCRVCNGDCSAIPGGPPYSCPTYHKCYCHVLPNGYGKCPECRASALLQADRS